MKQVIDLDNHYLQKVFKRRESDGVQTLVGGSIQSYKLKEFCGKRYKIVITLVEEKELPTNEQDVDILLGNRR